MQLGDLVYAKGSAWLAANLVSLSLRGGYDAWFLGARETGRGLGLRADWHPEGSLVLSAAYDYDHISFGVGLKAGSEPAYVQLWIRNRDWLLSGEMRAGGFALFAWQQGSYTALAPSSYGLRACYNFGNAALWTGFDNRYGYLAGASWHNEYSAKVKARWNPGRSALVDASLRLPLREGAFIQMQLSYSPIPIAAAVATVEMHVPLERRY